jgi:hypothetical protein
MAMKGGTSDSVNLANLPSDNYTMFHVARYVTGGSTGRLFSANSGNWISGFYYGMNGCAHHNAWLTSSGCDSDNLYGWELSMDQLYYFRHNGEDVSMARNDISTQSRSNTFGINNYFNGQKADWEVADVIVFDRKLGAGEIRLMEAYLARIYGLTLSQASGSNETDTAYSWNSQYYYGQYDTGFYINDTFTVEGWVKPGAECTSSYCSWFSLQVALVTKIDGGTFHYALGGTASGYVWTDTGVKIPTGEWHHIALVKKLIGNQANAMEFYLDGQLAFVDSGSPYNNGAASGSTTDVVTAYDSWYYLGVRANESANFRGSMDEFKFWKVARTAAQIASDMHSQDASDPGLQLYYDFNFNSLSNSFDLRNLAMHGPSRTDMVASSTHKYEDVKSVVSTAPYTTITFPRTYITQNGGWRVPESVTAATTIVVGGGGGGGFGSSSNRPAGAGGGGGVAASLTQSYSPGAIIPIKVGQGGLGGFAASDPSVRNGQSSFVGVGETLTALGGGGGGNNSDSGAGGASVATGGGSGETTLLCSGTPPNASPSSGVFRPGATVPSGYNGAGGAWGWGGSGGGARGAAINGDCNNFQAGVPGPGFIDPITSIEYGRGGNAAGYSTTSLISGYTTQNNGWGGIISYNGGNTTGVGYRGSSGTVVIRYITPFKPRFTPPTNAYLNVGMTETFTTNVAQDSATAGLTRTFRWESTTAGANGTYTSIKVGTGATNAAFSWVPTDTSTSGSQYLYRVVVTDSDTVGLFTQDTSPAVFAVINPALQFSATAMTVKKAINLSRSETFTISLGTPTYRYSLNPVIQGITLETNTAGVAVLRISDTASVGTYVETLTVTDSVSATLNIPITLTINAPPNLLSTSEILSQNLILNLEAGNSRSILLDDTATATSVPWNDLSGRQRNARTGGVSAATYDGRTCTAPKYYRDFGGYVEFNGTSDCYYTDDIGKTIDGKFSVEAWYRATGTLTSVGASILAQNSAGNIGIVLGGATSAGTTDIRVGFYNGTWRHSATGHTPVIGNWYHYVGTYDGANFKLYVNGVLIDTTPYVGSLTGTVNNTGYFIGRRWDGNSYLKGSIAALRVYDQPMSLAQVQQNFNATKARFDVSNQAFVKPVQKYGAITLESFTVTSGGDTETVSFAVGDRAGISWDTTSVPNQVRLIVQETLTPGTYYDTITVTDNFAQSSILPIRFTVTKADTLTIFIDTPTALNYTGNRALLNPSVRTIGAVGFESGTAVSTTIRFKPAGTTCATGGYCRIGDIGPGGGIVFIDTSTSSSDGRIYEVAPQNWSGSDDLSTVGTFCSNNSSTIGSTQIGIGWGETNTNLAKASCLGGAVGRVNSFNLSNSTGYSDWFIPSRNEGIELAKIAATAGLLNIGSNWSVGNWGYWGSTEVNSSTMSAIGHTGAVFNGTSNVLKSESTKNMVRPVRAFKSCWAIDTCTALLTTETPTAAGIYMISPTSGASAATLAERYSSIRYVESRLTINRIAQRAQVIPFINVNFPDTFTVNVTEGNGNGAITYSATNGTSTGCGFDYKKLYAATQGTCTITVFKSGDRNYLPDTATAGMYLLSFVNNQPTAGVGSGPNIALSGQTSVTVDPNVAPTITSLSTYTAQAGVTQIVITGVGFDSSNLAGITVKFWRNIVASGFTVNAQNTEITVTVPAGATTGKVLVTTPNGQAVSEFALTITP